MENIFRELKNGYETLRVREQDDNIKYRYDALNDINEYINSFCWFNGSFKLKENLEICLNFPAKQWSERTGKSRKNCNLILKRASDTIRGKIGFDKIEMSLTGTLQQVKGVREAIRIARHEKYASEMIMSDVLRRISRYSSSNEYKMTDLQNELRFLSFFTTFAWKNNIKKVDSNKLSYIIQILNSSDGGYLADKVEIRKYLLKHKDIDLAH